MSVPDAMVIADVCLLHGGGEVIDAVVRCRYAHGRYDLF